MNSISLLGFAAGTLTTVSFIPQVVRSWRRRSVDDISLPMLLTFATGIGFWFLYGIATAAPPIIITNAATFALVVALIGMKFRFRSY